MQRELTARLAELAELETISLRHFDCIVLSRDAVLKLFMPRSKRLMLGTPKDRMIFGEVLTVFADAVKPMKPPSKRFDYTDLVFSAPLANFPGLEMYEVNGAFVDAEGFFQNLKALASFFPESADSWRQTFSDDFFDKPPL